MKRTLSIPIFALLIALMAIAAFPALASDEPVAIPVTPDVTFFRTPDGIEVWIVDADGNAQLSIRMSNDELDAVDDAPESTLLVAQSGSVAFYKSTNGEWAVTAADTDGKTRVVVFDEDLGYSSQYDNSF